MWVMKIKFRSEQQFLGRMAIKHQVSMTDYPLSYWKDKNWVYMVAAGFIFGEEKNKKALIRDMKKQPEVVKFEEKDDFSTIITKQPLFTEAVYNPKIIRPSPVVINPKEGKHTWVLASFERKILERVLKFAKKYYNAEVLKFKEEKLSNISITKVLPGLTKKQIFIKSL